MGIEVRIAARRGPWRSVAQASRLALALLLLTAAGANLVIAFGAQPWLSLAPLAQVVDLDGLGWGRVGMLTIAVLMALIARAIARGKRQAWLLAVGILALSLVLEILEGANLHSMLVEIALLAILVALTPLFPTRGNLRAAMRGYAALACGGWLTWAHTFLVHVTHSGLPGSTPIAPEVALPVALLLVLTRVLCYAILGYGVLQLLSPALGRRCNAVEEHLRAAAVIARYGWISTVHFTLGADKSYFWSESGRSLIAYRVTLGVALALSDPIGPAEEREQTLRAFVAYCRQQDWQVALYQTTGELRQVCRRMGMHAVKIGEDPIVELDRFTLEGKIGAPVRHSVARARRGGLAVRIFQGEPLPDELFAGMKRVSDAWLRHQKAAVQFGYSMGRFPLDWNEELLTAVALGPDGAVQAYVTWTPLYAGNGWALDNMRRAETTEPGAMELLLAECLAWAKARDAERMTLGLVPFAGLTTASAADSSSGTARTRGGPTLLERSAAYLHRRGLLLGNYRSLYAFKAKFQVEWHPRYLVVGELGALPQVLSALAVAMGAGWRGFLRDAWDAMRARREFPAAPAPAIPTTDAPPAEPIPAATRPVRPGRATDDELGA